MGGVCARNGGAGSLGDSVHSISRGPSKPSPTLPLSASVVSGCPQGVEGEVSRTFDFHFSNDYMVTASGHGVSFWGDENVRELGSGDAYPVAIS